MKIIVNNIEKDVPFTLDAVTLGQYLGYLRQYGKLISEDPSKEPLAWFQFFSGFDFLNGDDFIRAQAIEQWRIYSPILKDENEVPELATDWHEWNGELWSFQNFSDDELDPVKFYHNHKALFFANQFLLAKSFPENPWPILPALCAVFFRRRDEQLADKVLRPHNERYQLMLTLPMHLAMCIKNHLLTSIQPIHQ
jgi:hypothetical protein